MGSYGKVLEDMRRYGKVWKCMTKYGEVLEDIGRDGNIWEGMGRYGKDKVRYMKVEEVMGK